MHYRWLMNTNANALNFHTIYFSLTKDELQMARTNANVLDFRDIHY